MTPPYIIIHSVTLLRPHSLSGTSLLPGARKRNEVWLLPVECVVWQREMMLEICAEYKGVMAMGGRACVVRGCEGCVVTASGADPARHDTAGGSLEAPVARFWVNCKQLGHCSKEHAHCLFDVRGL